MEAKAWIDGEQRWLEDTLRRLTVRYGRVAGLLAEVPGLLIAAGKYGTAFDAADVLADLQRRVYRAVDELARCDDYLWSAVHPGPATCRVCGADIAVLGVLSDWQHYRILRDSEGRELLELFDVTHEARPKWGVPERTDWAEAEGDLTAE